MMSPHRMHCVRLQATAFPLHCTHGGKVVSGGGYAYHKLCYSTNSSHCITKYCNLHRRTKMTRSDQQMAEIQNLLSDPIKHTHISHDRMDLNRFDGLRECDKTVCVMQISRFPSIIRKLHARVCVCVICPLSVCTMNAKSQSTTTVLFAIQDYRNYLSARCSRAADNIIYARIMTIMCAIMPERAPNKS